MDGTSIGTLCTDLLGTLNDAYTIVAGAPAAPALQYVSFGEPARYDGDLLVVWCAGVRLTNPFPLTQLRAVGPADVPTADLTFEVLRSCWPQPELTTAASSQLPKPDDVQTAALAAVKDASTLWAHLSMVAAKGGMFPSFPTIRTGDLGLPPLVPVGPQGTHVGWRGTVAVKLVIP